MEGEGTFLADISSVLICNDDAFLKIVRFTVKFQHYTFDVSPPKLVVLFAKRHNSCLVFHWHLPIYRFNIRTYQLINDS